MYQKGKQLKTEIKNENIKEIKTLLDDDKVDITDAALMKKLLDKNSTLYTSLSPC